MKIKYLLFAFIFPFIVFSQEKQNSFFSIQTGFLGVWVNNETTIKDSFVLKSEIGLDTGLFGGNEITNFVLYPNISLQPKYYYSFKKRNEKGLNTNFNSGNFIGLKLKYNPNWFTISNVDNISIAENISIIPKWGIKRNYFKHLAIELGGGVGYRKYLIKQSNSGEVAVDLLLRIGYIF